MREKSAAADPLSLDATLLGLLIAADLGFLAMFAALAAGLTDDLGFRATYDRSYAEVFQYLKLYWIVLLMGLLAWRRGSLLAAGFALLFAFLLVDDYASLHEQWGEQLATAWDLPAMWMLQPYDFGELIVFFSYAAITGPLLLLGYRFADARDRLLLWDLFRLLALLAVFAVGVDVLHALSLPELISNLIGAFEDGGEMIVVSLLVWRTLQHATDRVAANPQLELNLETTNPDRPQQRIA